MCKKPDQINQLEKTIRDLKRQYLPILEKALGTRVARLEITVYLDLIIRCVFCKPWPAVEPRVTLPVGKFSDEKIKALGLHWAKVVDLKHPTLGFAEAAGLQADVKEDPTIQQEVGLENLRSLGRHGSDGPEPECTKFKRGDEVTMDRRMSWILPQKSNPKFRKDITEGTEGVIEGYADPDMRTVLLKVDITISGKQQTHTQAVTIRNLNLTSDYLLARAGEAVGPSSSSTQEASSSGEPHKDKKHVVGDSDPANVKVEDKWKSLLADADDLCKTMYLRGSIAVGLQALSEVMPKYSEKDFILVNRKNDKGLWKSELWTKRDFEPLEIQLAPISSQIKETHLMASAHAVVTIPKHGRGAHPENLSLATDGRSRNLIAKSGSLDKDDHAGSLFWVVTRTSETKEVNLELDNVTWSQNIKMSLPAPKKRKTGRRLGSFRPSFIPGPGEQEGHQETHQALCVPCKKQG